MTVGFPSEAKQSSAWCLVNRLFSIVYIVFEQTSQPGVCDVTLVQSHLLNGLTTMRRETVTQ